LEASDAYRKFCASRNADTITEYEFRDMLLCTLESPTKTLRSNMAQFKQHVAVYKRQDLAAFLDACGQKFCRLLEEQGPSASMTRGGMLPAKSEKEEGSADA
jgi:hypothetical protein